MKNEIIIFENQKVKLEVNLEGDTVWLSLDQMSKLFDRDKSVISRHIKNALTEELDSSTVANFATVQKEGKREITRNIEYYNLDMIISVGYRVKSQNGVIFYLEKTVKLVDIATRITKDELKDTDASEILKTINNYSNALNLLDDYDHRKLVKPNGTKSNEIITYDNCMDLIGLLKFNEESDIFALERNKGLSSIINNIYQSFDNKDVYPTIEEKAANFLYLIIKNHTFIDGNKRIAATLFIYFLEFYNILYKDNTRVIDNNTLVAITLLVAESNPKEKDILIDLIMNFLK